METPFESTCPIIASFKELKAGIDFIVDHIVLKTWGARLAIEEKPLSAVDAIIKINIL
jgi:hypothetical protein